MYLKRFQNLYTIDRTRIAEPDRVAFRLQRNEKPDNWPKVFLEKIYGSIPDNLLQRYPDPGPFYTKLAGFTGVKEENIVVTSGIDEPIKSLITLCCEPGDSIAAVVPGYAMYGVYARLLSVGLTSIRYDPENFLTPTRLVTGLPDTTKIIFLPNPSQPVENCFDLDQLREIAALCQSSDILLAIDEAYHLFGAPNAIPLITEFENVVVMRTFSKAFGAASIRLGYVIGSKKSLAPLSAFRLAHEANSFSLHVGLALLNAFDSEVKQNIKAVCEGRDYLREQCRGIGLKAWGELSNNVLIDLGSDDCMLHVLKGLKEKGIFVKGGFAEPLDSHLLVTCGPREMMKPVFIKISSLVDI